MNRSRARRNAIGPAENGTRNGKQTDSALEQTDGSAANAAPVNSTDGSSVRTVATRQAQLLQQSPHKNGYLNKEAHKKNMIRQILQNCLTII